MEKVCDLCPKIYQCVTLDLTTTEVILTEERAQHIKDHHPGVFEQYRRYLKEIIEQPDYILSDERPNTAMVLKEFREKNIRFRLSLRLRVPEDAPAYKNSILTFMRIREKEWNRLLRNKKILYKFE